MVLGGGRGGGPPIMDAPGQKSRFSRSSRSASKASEICLRASEKTVGESLTGLHGGNTVVAHGVQQGVRSRVRVARKAPEGMTNRRSLHYVMTINYVIPRAICLLLSSRNSSTAAAGWQYSGAVVQNLIINIEKIEVQIFVARLEHFVADFLQLRAFGSFSQDR